MNTDPTPAEQQATPALEVLPDPTPVFIPVKIKQIQDKIEGHKAELRELEQKHNKLTQEVQQMMMNNQRKADQLTGMITALEALLPKQKDEKNGGNEPVPN